jgi:hypothetical protein
MNILKPSRVISHVKFGLESDVSENCSVFIINVDMGNDHVSLIYIAYISLSILHTFYVQYTFYVSFEILDISKGKWF